MSKFIFIVWMLALFTCYCTVISYVPRNMLQVPNTSTGQVLRKRYIDKSDLFSVSYPAFGKLNSTSSSYTRFEYINKVTDDYSTLMPLEFYLEIFKDDIKNVGVADLCKNAVTKIPGYKYMKYVNKILVYQGYGPQGGDSGGTRYSICFQKNKKQFMLNLTTNTQSYLLPFLKSFTVK